MAKKNPKPRSKRPSPKVWTFYKVENGKLIRLRKFCPRCGPGVYLAQHPDRLACGKCGYTEFLKK
ncbi:30S ribosomal protein S27ae [Candidatus Geothermarchaeota archaeon ex4572_27]|nr:MAG: 30S ribosomal protein S27ae [Candidatus Geothermarchaeota archaeon ex4572_27]